MSVEAVDRSFSDGDAIHYVLPVDDINGAESNTTLCFVDVRQVAASGSKSEVDDDCCCHCQESRA